MTIEHESKDKALMHRCWCCQGSKQVMGGGCIFKECHVCSGTGKIFAETLTIAQSVAEAVVELKDVKDLPYVTSPEIVQRAQDLAAWAAKELARPVEDVTAKVESDVLPMLECDPEQPKNIKKRPKIRKRPLHPDTTLNV